MIVHNIIDYWAWLNKWLFLSSSIEQVTLPLEVEIRDWLRVSLHLAIHQGGFHRWGWRPRLLLPINCEFEAVRLMKTTRMDRDRDVSALSKSCWLISTHSQRCGVKLRSMNRNPFWPNFRDLCATYKTSLTLTSRVDLNFEARHAENCDRKLLFIDSTCMRNVCGTGTLCCFRWNLYWQSKRL